VLAYLLLQDRSDMGVGGVICQGEDRSGEGVSQGDCGDEGALAAAKAVSMSSVHGRVLGLPESAAVSGGSVPATPGRKQH
jgi:hypothetical protein